MKNKQAGDIFWMVIENLLITFWLCRLSFFDYKDYPNSNWVFGLTALVFFSVFFGCLWYKMSISDSLEEKRRLLGYMLNTTYLLPIIGIWLYFHLLNKKISSFDKIIKDEK